MQLILISLLMLSLSGCSTTKKIETDKKNNQNEEAKMPPLTVAVVKKVWVKSKIQGNEFHEGHWMYLIDKNVRWSE